MVAMGVVIATPHTASAAVAPVPLGTAGNFAVLAGTGVTNSGATSVTGDLGESPSATVAGFPPGIIAGTMHAGDATAGQAQKDLTAAYNNASTRTATATVASELGGTTKTPGVYNSASTFFTINGNLVLDAQGDPNAVFIFQSASTLVTGPGSTVTLTGGAQACNVIWAVAGTATLGATSRFAGSLLGLASIAVGTGATVNGRLLAKTTVTLDTDAVTRPVCQSARSTTTTLVSSCTAKGAQGPLTLTATVRSGSGTVPTGQVIFTSDGVSLGTAHIDGNGRATLTSPNLAEGVRRIIAAYPGTTLMDPSTSSVLLLRVGPNHTCPAEKKCDEDEKGKEDKEDKEVSTTDRDENRLLRNHRRDRFHHHRHHGRLVTVQTLHTLHGVVHEGGGGGHHSSYHAGSGHHPVHHHKVYYKAHKKPRMHHHYHHRHYYRPRPHVGVTG